MKVMRKVTLGEVSRNVEFELTGAELERAYNEYVSNHDRAEVWNQLKDLEYENVPDELVNELSSEFRSVIDEDRDDYILKIIHWNEEKLEEYKRKWKVFTCEVTQTKTHTYSIRAKDQQQAEEMLNRYVENHECEVESDMEDELPEYDSGWVREDDHWCDPDNADITEEE